MAAMAKPLADSNEMVMGPGAVAEDTVAGSDCADPAAPEGNVREDDTVSCVVGVSDNDNIIDVVGYVIVEGVVLIDLEVVRLITCRYVGWLTSLLFT